MGNISDADQQSIIFVQTLHDSNFGQIQIYRDGTGKFIMKQIRTFIYNPNQPRYQNFQAILNNFQKSIQANSKQSEYFVPILYSKKSIKNNLCIVYQTVQIYSQYFNHTLLDLIKSSMRLQKSEIWMCLKWMLQLICIIQKNKWAIDGDLTLQKIFVTPRGKNTFYSNFLTIRKEQIVSNGEHTKQQVENYYEVQLIKQAIACLLSLINGKIINTHQVNKNLLQQCCEFDPILAKLISNIWEGPTQQQQLRAEYVIQIINFWTQQKKISIAKQMILNRSQLKKQSQQIRYSVDCTKKKQQRVTPIKIIHKFQNRSTCSITKRTDRDTITDTDQIDLRSSFKPQLTIQSIKTVPLKKQSNKKKLIHSVQEPINTELIEKTMKNWLSSKKNSATIRESFGRNKQNMLQNSIHLLSTRNRRQSFRNKSRGDYYKQTKFDKML